MKLCDLEWEKVEEEGSVAYRATGPRGAEYGLVRNVHHPQQMFAISIRSRKIFPGWYTDRDGTIKRIC